MKIKLFFFVAQVCSQDICVFYDVNYALFFIDDLTFHGIFAMLFVIQIKNIFYG